MEKEKEKLCVGSYVLQEFTSPERRKHMEEGKIYSLEMELIQKCAGACAYCFASSTGVSDDILPKEKVREILDDGYELGARYVMFSGGDPLLHPDLYDLCSYAKEKGMLTCILTASLISKEQARQLVNLNPNEIGIHIDTIHQETYNKIHTDPKTLEMKIRGFKNLLEAGYPSNRTFPLITMTKPSASRIEETVDWFVDEMGADHMCYLPLKPQGFGKEKLKNWEPSLSDLTRAVEYRAKKLGADWLKIGVSDAAMPACRTNVVINPNGNISPCALLSELHVGNVYKERFKDIVENNKDKLLFQFEIKGFCGEECENRDYCFGCRSNAHHYTGDITASDPRCFMNPEAKEHYFNK